MSENQTETPRLSLEQVVTQIKELISRSALAKIKIGELLNEYTAEIPHGEKEQFYKDIGMSPTTAQYYMKIASDPKVQKLKSEDKLEGLNMTTILELAGIRTQKREKVDKVEYVPVSIESFDYRKCQSTVKLKVQYGLLSNRVAELEARLVESEKVEKPA